MTASLHFGPEWMRDKRTPKSRNSQDISPSPSQTPSNGTSYSSVLTPTNLQPQQLEARDSVHPFRYGKEDILQVWRDGGGRAGLGLEVERWEGIIRETAGEPIALREMTDAERKLFSSVNSDLRRRASHDPGFAQPLSTLNRPKLGHAVSSQDAYGRERGGALLNSRRKKDSADYPVPLARKLSLSISQTDNPISPRDTIFTSPRSRHPSNIQSPNSALGGEPNLWGPKRTLFDSISKRHPDASSDEERIYSIQSKDAISHGVESPGELTRTGSDALQIPEEDATRLEDLGDSKVPIGGELSLPTCIQDFSNHPPPGLLLADPKQVQWTYIDPTGKVQGPFNAEAMQKWNDQGYFHPELPMRREGIDGDYLPLGQLVGMSNGPTFFLNSFPPIPSQVPVLQPAPLPGERFLGGPSSVYQTVTNGFDNYHCAMPGQLESPAFYQQGFGYVHSSSVEQEQSYQQSYQPFPEERWGRGNNLDEFLRNSSPGSIGVLTQSLSTSPPRFDSPRVGIIGRGTAGQHLLGANGLGGEGQRIDNWSPVNGIAVEDLESFPNLSSPNPARTIHNMSTVEHRHDPQAIIAPSAGTSGIPLYSSEYMSIHQQQFNSAIGQFTMSPQLTSSPNPEDNSTAYVEQFREAIPGPGDMNFTAELVEEPRTHAGALPSPTTDEHQPYEAISMVLRSALNEELEVDQSTAQPEVPIEKETSSAVAPPESVSDPPATEAAKTGKSKKSKFAESSGESSRCNDGAKLDLAIQSAQDLSLSDQARRSATVKEPLQDTIESQSKNLSSSLREDLATSVQRAKAPWATSESSVPLPKAQFPGLRQIQIELKKEEEKKAIERKQRFVAARTASSNQHSEELIVGAWGLPTSQAGSRNKEKEIITTVSSGTPGPVWTNVVRPHSEKKSMKEILEEEKRHQALQRDKEIAASLAKRAYAESATKSTPIANEPVSGGWTTVGMNGKAVSANNWPSAQTNNSPSPIPLQSSALLTQRSTSNSAPINRISSVSISKAPVQAARVEERRYDPSLEFLRWLRDSLKGLNAGVNVDEFIQMLLSFPIDASQDAIDLIQEQAYANSTTIDGRRFAAEFIMRRKADSQPHSQGNGATRVASLADVVKTPQKPPQSDWGYKVVKKKGRGVKGR